MMGQEPQTIEYDPTKWRSMDSSSKKLAQIHADAYGHVTVTCHCAGCEAERVERAPMTLKEYAASVSDEEKAEVARFVEGHLSDGSVTVPMSELVVDGRDQDRA